ncbi:MAG: hypothetical protein V3U28_06710 [Candidatus Acidoferrales bacterium]
MKVRIKNLPRLEASEVGRPRYRMRNPILEGKLYQFRQPLWDVYAAIAATALVARTLFQTPAGGQFTPIGGVAITKTRYHTNMTQAGVLPSPQKFFTKAISVSYREDVNLADATRFGFDTLARFTISSREYLEIHAYKLPGAGGAYGFTSGIITNGLPERTNQFLFAGQLGEVIEQLQTVAVQLDPTLVSDASGSGVLTTIAELNVFVHLDGLLNREVL